MARERAAPPIWSEGRKAWVVGWWVIYEPGETVTVVRGHDSYPTKDEADAAVARINGRLT